MLFVLCCVVLIVSFVLVCVLIRLYVCDAFVFDSELHQTILPHQLCELNTKRFQEKLT